MYGCARNGKIPERKDVWYNITCVGGPYKLNNNYFQLGFSYKDYDIKVIIIIFHSNLIKCRTLVISDLTTDIG